MSDDLIDRLAAWVYRAVMQLPLGSAASQKPGAFAAAPVANPALRYRKPVSYTHLTLPTILRV